jgi:hypothetical protein
VTNLIQIAILKSGRTVSIDNDTYKYFYQSNACCVQKKEKAKSFNGNKLKNEKELKQQTSIVID